jgi:hypothetical protein
VGAVGGFIGRVGGMLRGWSPGGAWGVAWRSMWRGLDWARENLRWENRGALVDAYLSLHPGYLLTKRVTQELYSVTGLPPQAVEWELQGRYAAVVDTVAQTAAVGTVCALLPPAGVALSGYSFLSGRDPFTGRRLSDLEWGLAVVGLVGSVAYTANWLKEVDQESAVAEALAQGRRTSQGLAERIVLDNRCMEQGSPLVLEDGRRISYHSHSRPGGVICQT